MMRWHLIKGLLRSRGSLADHRQLACGAARRCTTTPKSFTEEGFVSSYSLEQQQLVLRTLNAASVEELRQFSVSKQRAARLVQQRQRKGDFGRLEDVLEVEDFGIKLIQNLCDSIVYGPSEEAKKQATSLWSQISHPRVSADLRKSLKSVLSFNLDVDRLVWVHLDRDMNLLDWNSVKESTKAYNHKHSLEQAHKVLDLLPKADAYVMDRRPLTARQSSIIPHMLGVLQLESMLVALLNGDFARTRHHCVFAVKGDVVARFFDLKIGNEVVSSQALVESILSSVHCDKFRKIQFGPGSRLWYDEQPRMVREELASCLLQAVAFYELGVVRGKGI